MGSAGKSRGHAETDGAAGRIVKKRDGQSECKIKSLYLTDFIAKK